MSDSFAVHGRVGSDGSPEFYDTATGAAVFNIRAKGNVQYAKVTMTAAQILALNATPVTILAAPGAGLSLYVHAMALYLNFGTAAFQSGTTVTFKQGTATLATTTAALINGGASALIQPAFPAEGTTASLGANNSAITANTTVAFTTGDSTVDVHIWYSLLTTP